MYRGAAAAAYDSPVFPISLAQVSSPPEPFALPVIPGAAGFAPRVLEPPPVGLCVVELEPRPGAHVLAHLVLGATGSSTVSMWRRFCFVSHLYPPEMGGFLATAISCTSSQFREIPGDLLILRPLPDSDVQVLLLFVRIERS